MKRIAALLGVAAGTAFLFPAAAGSSRRTEPAPVLGHLVLRGRRVTFKSDGRVTVRTPEGKAVAENVTLAELRAADPALHAVLERTVAGNRAGELWAGLLPRSERVVEPEPVLLAR